MLEAGRCRPAHRLGGGADALRRPARRAQLGRARARPPGHRGRPPGGHAGRATTPSASPTRCSAPPAARRSSGARCSTRWAASTSPTSPSSRTPTWPGAPRPTAGGRCTRPRAVVYHHHSATAQHGSPAKLYLVGRNRVRTLAKNASTGMLLAQRPLDARLRHRLRDLHLGGRPHARAAARPPARACASGAATGAAGAPHRRAVRLRKPLGFRRALQRHKGYTEYQAPESETA